MNPLVRCLLAGVVLALLLGGHAEALDVGSAAPPFTGTDIKGGAISLDDYKGAKHVVLVFYIGYT